MRSRLSDRVKALEAQILPKGRVFVFFSFDEPDPPSYDERLASFKAENGVGPNDAVHEVALTFSWPLPSSLHPRRRVLSLKDRERLAYMSLDEWESLGATEQAIEDSIADRLLKRAPPLRRNRYSGSPTALRPPFDARIVCAKRG